MNFSRPSGVRDTPSKALSSMLISRAQMSSSGMGMDFGMIAVASNLTPASLARPAASCRMALTAVCSVKRVVSWLVSRFQAATQRSTLSQFRSRTAASSTATWAEKPWRRLALSRSLSSIER